MKKTTKKTLSMFALIPFLLSMHQCAGTPIRSPLTNINFSNQDLNFKELNQFLGFKIPTTLIKYYKTIDKVISKGITYINNADRYTDNRNIDGWFDKRVIILLAMINDHQTKNNILGNVAEIGVWQGRSFISLMLLAKKTECAIAIDCFEQSTFDYENSGLSGFSSDPFMHNVKKYSSDTTNLKIIKGDSYKLTAQDYLRAANNNLGVRIFSIDGCHEAAPTEHDMENAFKCLVDGGIIMIDDYFQETWPAVSEGVNSFMFKNINGLKPFFIGWDKIFFAHPAHTDSYFQLLKKAFPEKDLTIKKFFGVDTLIYDPKI